jgi:hypothetical protein
VGQAFYGPKKPKVSIEVLYVDFHVGHRLGAVDKHQCTVVVGCFCYALTLFMAPVTFETWLRQQSFVFLVILFS